MFKIGETTEVAGAENKLAVRREEEDRARTQRSLEATQL